MSTELVYFLQSPLTLRDYARYGVEILRARGAHVSFVDLTPIVHPRLAAHQDSRELNQIHNVFCPSQLSDLRQWLEPKRAAVGINLVSFHSPSWIFFRMLKKIGFPYASIQVNRIPTAPTWVRWRNRLSWTSAVVEGAFRKSIRQFLGTGRDRFGWFQRPSWVFLGGRKGTEILPRPDHRTRCVPAHTWDYDLYLQGSPPFPLEGPYGVFLDEYLPFHPDYLVDPWMNPGVDPGQYYNGLNVFLHAAEQAWGCPIVVAAHPRSHYDQHPECFPHRQVIKGFTPALVAKSRFAISHASTSLNFAVIHRKPIFIIGSSPLTHSCMGPQIQAMADALGREVWAMDDSRTWNFKRARDVNEFLYQEYCDDYIKYPGSSDRLFWDLVGDVLLSNRVP